MSSSITSVGISTNGDTYVEVRRILLHLCGEIANGNLPSEEVSKLAILRISQATGAHLVQVLVLMPDQTIMVAASSIPEQGGTTHYAIGLNTLFAESKTSTIEEVEGINGAALIFRNCGYALFIPLPGSKERPRLAVGLGYYRAPANYQSLKATLDEMQLPLLGVVSLVRFAPSQGQQLQHFHQWLEYNDQASIWLSNKTNVALLNTAAQKLLKVSERVISKEEGSQQLAKFISKLKSLKQNQKLNLASQSSDFHGVFQLASAGQLKVFYLASKQTDGFPEAGELWQCIELPTVSELVLSHEADKQDLRAKLNQYDLDIEAKSAFLANMSHEIRTPMNGVLGMASLLNNTELTAEQQEYVDTIKLSGDALLSLVNDFLDFSKIESGRLELESKPFAVHQAIEDTFDMLGLRALERKLNLVYAIDPSIPFTITGDINRLRQVLINLVSNGIKFTEQGEIEVSVSLLEREDDWSVLLFTVRDSGIGIPRDKFHRLFQPFSQVDASTARSHGGTGLGLAICDRLVKLMGGRIWFESEQGIGSTFLFTIQAPVQDGPKSYAEVLFEPELKGKQVAILHKNSTVLKVLARICENQGMNVYYANDLLSLSEEIKGQAIDLLLADEQSEPLLQGSSSDQLNAMGFGVKVPMIAIGYTSAFVPRKGGPSDKLIVSIDAPIKALRLQQVIKDLLLKPSELANAGISRPSDIKHIEARDSRLSRTFKILVAEDNLINQKLLVKCLEKLGFTAMVVNNGVEALEAVEQLDFDLILMDVQMPELDGISATKMILSDLPNPLRRPKIVAMTANAGTDDVEACFAAGMDDYLSKPFTLDGLRRKMEKWSFLI